MPEINTEIVAMLRNAVGADAFASMTGQFASDLNSLQSSYLAARAAQDETAAREAAHALKGAAANIGLARLATLAGNLEAGHTEDEGELEATLNASLNALNTVE